MEEHEVRLVHEEAGWRIYQDDMPVMGKTFEHSDDITAKSEARQLARKISPCVLIIIDLCGCEIYRKPF